MCFFTDNNECLLGTDGCHENADCVNTNGNYDCDCRQGFIGDGRQNCIGKDNH